jgi:formate hydrogenlyase transcriptional activator
LLSEGIRSACWLPLVRGSKAIGVLNIASLHEDAFTRAQMELLSQVANQVSIAVENALAFRQITELKNPLAEEKVYLEDELRTEHSYDEIVGESPAWRNILQQVEIVAPTDSAVLILGETGTGKELIARAIHEQSSRRERTFVKTS